MAACDQDVFGILVEIDGYRRAFHVAAPIVVYFGNRMSRDDRMYHATKQNNTYTFR